MYGSKCLTPMLCLILRLGSQNPTLTQGKDYDKGLICKKRTNNLALALTIRIPMDFVEKYFD